MKNPGGHCEAALRDARPTQWCRILSETVEEVVDHRHIPLGYE